MRVKDIARRQQISPPYIEQIFQKLKRASIPDTKRGPTRGYFLVKRPEDITVGIGIKKELGSKFMYYI
jgi:DNA-binding IscR family transcriptional regulator